MIARMILGGGWYDAATGACVTDRYGYAPLRKYGDIGVRCVRVEMGP